MSGAIDSMFVCPKLTLSYSNIVCSTEIAARATTTDTSS